MVLLETEVKMEKITKKDDDVLVIILLYKNPNFKSFFKTYDLEIYGKKMWKYVELACSDYEVKTTICTPEIDLLQTIKPMLTDKQYTVVLFSDTPLIKKSTLNEIVTYAKSKQINFMNLSRGYVFNTEYLKEVDKIQSSLIERFDEEDFLQVFDAKNFEFATQIMKTRILDFHQKNGILIYDIGSTNIDADVIIETGTIIYPNNTILGKSFIGKNSVLKNGNVISSSIIGANSVVVMSYIENQKIDAHSVIGPFANLRG